MLAICYVSVMDQLVCHVFKHLTFRQIGPRLRMELAYVQKDFIVKTMHVYFVLMDVSIVLHQQFVKNVLKDI